MGRKIILWIFLSTNWSNLAQEDLDRAKRETKSLPITAQNNSIRTNYIKAKIDNMQKTQ